LYRAKQGGRNRVEVENATLESLAEVHGDVKSEENERKHIRRSGLNRLVQVHASHQGKPVSVQGRIRDISEGGIGAVIPCSLQIDEQVALIFCIEDGHECTVLATVRHCREFDYGLEFVSIEPSLRDAIARLCG
jgi:c-di-GMP-binding flagellar brake protein YcgR